MVKVKMNKAPSDQEKKKSAWDFIGKASASPSF